MKIATRFLLMAILMVVIGSGLISCGRGASQVTAGGASLVGNWQFTMAAPSDQSFVGGIQGGFLQENNGAITGSATYAILQKSSDPQPCNGGSAPITGKISGQNVTLTAAASGQTFTLAGKLSSDGTTIMGTYTSTAGSMTGASNTACGTAQTGLQWSARLVPPLNGVIQGFFHSNPSSTASVKGQNFPLTGVLIQGDNIGASSATVTGTLTFQGYSCLGSASHQTVNVSGEISGSSVVLQIFADNGLTIGQIGAPENTSSSSSANPVKYESMASGDYVVHGASGYSVTTKSCPNGDLGNLCMAMGNATDCTQPISLFPAAITFPTRLVGSDPVTQTITLTNGDPSGSTLTGLSLNFSNVVSSGFPDPNPSDFSGLPNFTEQDNCASSPGATFNLAPQQSCTITISFAAQQSCPWLPSDLARSKCPPFLGATVPLPPGLGATLTVTSPQSADSDTTFVVPIKGVGLSALTPSTPELDFGAEAVTEASLPQQVTFTNGGTFPVRILPSGNACTSILPQPIQAGSVNGIQIVYGISGIASTTAPRNTVQYGCDIDKTSGLPNFQITSDACSGAVLAPQGTCAISIRYAPQPASPPSTSSTSYFLELNTQQCPGGSAQADCEIDSGRFPVALTANPASSLRMTPGAGLDFGATATGTLSNVQTITLYNDPQDPNAGTVTFKGNLVTGDYLETDNCGGSLASGSSCTLNIIFKPNSTGFDPGTLTITYTSTSPKVIGPQQQTVYLRGFGQ